MFWGHSPEQYWLQLEQVIIARELRIYARILKGFPVSSMVAALWWSAVEWKNVELNNNILTILTDNEQLMEDKGISESERMRRCEEWKVKSEELRVKSEEWRVVWLQPD